MYDGRRKLHREMHAGLGAGWPVIPMSSQIEQMAARRQPLGTFATTSEASRRLQQLWEAIESKLQTRASLMGASA